MREGKQAVLSLWPKEGLIRFGYYHHHHGEVVVSCKVPQQNNAHCAECHAIVKQHGQIFFDKTFASILNETPLAILHKIAQQMRTRIH